VSASKPRKGPPKKFETHRAAKEALTNLADSLSTHSFPWPAAAIRSFLRGHAQSLDEAFGLPEKAVGNQSVTKKQPAAALSAKRARSLKKSGKRA
jgi:hypothetical protein